jgi:hypothetical protein
MADVIQHGGVLCKVAALDRLDESDGAEIEIRIPVLLEHLAAVNGRGLDPLL